MPEHKASAERPWYERFELPLSVANQVLSMVLTALTIITAPHFEKLEEGVDGGNARSVVFWCVIAAVVWIAYLAFLIWYEIAKARMRAKKEDEVASLRKRAAEMEGQRSVIACLSEMADGNAEVANKAAHPIRAGKLEKVTGRSFTVDSKSVKQATTAPPLRRVGLAARVAWSRHHGNTPSFDN